MRGADAIRAPNAPGATTAVLLWVMACAPNPAFAQSASVSYEIPRASFDGGADRSASVIYTLAGSIGQPDAAPATSSNQYVLRGGFHVPARTQATGDPVFADGFESP